MANEKNQNKPASNDLDLAKLLEGTNLGGAGDFRVVEGLVPAYTPEMASAEGWAPVVGELLRINMLPTLHEGQPDKEFTPLAFEVLLAKDNKAIVGKEGAGRRIVDVKKGETLQVFISGNLQTKKDLLKAALDENMIWPVIMRVTGREKVNDMPSKMWVWETFLGGKGRPRPAQYRLLPQDINLRDIPAIVRGEVPELTEGTGVPAGNSAQPQTAQA